MSIVRGDKWWISCSFHVSAPGQVWSIDQISSELGIQPTRAWSTGDPYKAGIPRYADAWMIDSDTDSMEAEAHLRNLMDRTKNVPASGRAFLQKCEVGVTLLISEFYDEVPVITIHVDVSKWLVEMNAHFTADIMNTNFAADDEDEDSAVNTSPGDKSKGS